jgi:hypothetical protein
MDRIASFMSHIVTGSDRKRTSAGAEPKLFEVGEAALRVVP